MDIRLDRENPTPIHLQIAHGIREQILKGMIPVGGRLPPSRKLAQRLSVNRSTVIQAYNKLWAEGLIEAKVGMGTVVRPVEAPREATVGPPTWGFAVTRDHGTLESEVHELVRLFDREDLISLAAGLPGPDLYPIDEAKTIASDVLAREGRALLQWCTVEGYAPLRRLLADRFDTVSPADVMVLSGSTQGLYLLAQTMIEPGDFVIVQSPTYLGALQAFRTAGARLIGIPTDTNGMDLEMLASVLSRTRPKFMYILPTFQNPTGTTMTLEARRSLLELAYQYRVPIIEDDPYSLLRYEGENLPALKSLDTHEYVIYLSTFSKILFPGLRVGWLAAPRRVIDSLAPAKHMLDLFTDSLAQAIVHRFLQGGLLEKHLDRARREYRRRRDAMDDALRRHCPKLAFVKPQGGYFVWCTLPRGVAARELLRGALERRVSFLTGEIFFPDGRGQDQLRLSFTSQKEDAIEEGIRRIGVALRRLKREGTQRPAEKELAIKPIV